MTTFADKLFNVLASSRRPGESLPKERWLAIVNEFVEAERPLGKDGKAKKPAKRTPINKMTEDEFMAYLLSEPSLAGIDIPRERGKCLFWCKSKGKEMTRMRLINWLGRADKTLTNHGRSADLRAADAAERTVAAPHGWVEWMIKKQQDWKLQNGEYDPPGLSALERRDFFGMPKSWREQCRKELPC